MQREPNKPSARTKILNAALKVVRMKGYTATTVDDLCNEAGVTKGAFFHHFESKAALAVEAAKYWSEVTGQLFAAADYNQFADPADRVLGYLKLRRQLVSGSTAEFTCLVGTMVQETFHSDPAIRDACHDSIFGHAAVIERDIEEARRLYAPDAKWTARSLALHTQAVLQGAFILAKSEEDTTVAIDSVDHLIRYVESLFPKTTASKPKEKKT